jgi:hypothetical protein
MLGFLVVQRCAAPLNHKKTQHTPCALTGLPDLVEAEAASTSI